MRLLFITAASKIGVGLAVALWFPLAAPVAPEALPSWYVVSLLVAFGASGTVLYWGGRSDARAQALALVLLLFGSMFADRVVVRAMASVPPALVPALTGVAATHLVAFAPFAFWRFAWQFPRPQPGLLPRVVPSLLGAAALTTAVLLAGGNLLAFAAGPSAGALRAWLAPESDVAVFWQALALLTLPSLGVLLLKLRTATAEERRRVAWVIAGLAFGTLPMVLHVLLVTVVPPYAAFASDPFRRRVLGIVLTACALVIPASTWYAVAVDRVLEVRFVLRRAVQYGLARYTVLGAMAGLAFATAWMVYENRARPIDSMFRESPASAVFLLLLAGVLAWRRPLLDGIDRRFFREQYDARRILLQLADRTQKAATTRELLELIVSEVDRALHVERISLLVSAPERAALRDPEGRLRDLTLDGALGALLSGSRAPFDADLSADGSPLDRLPEVDRDWLADAGCRMLVPIFGLTSEPLGVLVLGDKRSELPFTGEDRQLLAAVAASAALPLQRRLHLDSPDPRGPDSPAQTPAAQCLMCRRVQRRSTPPCEACGGPIRPALVPATLAGKFELERQIGAGGMGVVYLARDLTLDRPVAIKVLPRLGSQAVARLRREARVMAVLQHPNLAVIHAMESWHGSPMLVMEYLAGGTLADRIRRVPLPIQEVIAIGIVIADVLRHVHRAGFLHRDVKPSNIGHTGDGAAKLLDFGLVRLTMELADASTVTKSAPAPAPLAAARGLFASLDTQGQQFVGTPAYLSPESIAMEAPGPGGDLWALAVTLYEAMCGQNPFAADSAREAFARITSGSLPDIRSERPECPAGLAEFFASALAADRRRRPQTAVAFGRDLRAASAGAVPAVPDAWR